MRQIEISTDVYAAIWALRKTGQESEDDILKSHLIGDLKALESDKKDDIGFSEARSGVYIPDKTRLFRDYKGTRYWAHVQNRCLVREDTEIRYNSLNSLNRSIVVGQESVWKGNWQYVDAAGNAKPVKTLTS